MTDLLKSTSATILPLPADAIAQIKSSTTITSINGVVLGLLENSLDAQATRVELSVDFRRGGCSIEDNGLGILSSEFCESGGLGRMYHTSKWNEDARHDLHGGQGTFIASVAALSQITITSRHRQHYSQNTLTIHRGKPISRLIPAPPQHEIRNAAAHGTRVTIRDLFGNVPIRVKQRAMNADEGSEVEKQWQNLKRGIVALLLPWRIRIMVKVSDTENPARNFSINTRANCAPNALNERNLNSLNQKMSSLDPSMVLNILAQAGFIPTESKENWIPASASTLSVTVKGLMSLEPAPSRSTQFISIGVTPCLGENRHNELYDTVNRMFTQSSFGKIEDDTELDSSELERRKYDRRYKTDGPTNRQLRGGRRGVDRWPKFYFHIELKNDTEAQLVSKLSDMRLRSITNVLEALATQWLEANKFCLRNSTRRKKTQKEREKQVPSCVSAVLSAPSSPRTESGLTSKLTIRNPRVRTASHAGFNAERGRNTRRIKENSETALSTAKLPFTDWSRIKSAKPQMYDNIWGCKMPLSRQQLDCSSHEHLEERPASASEVTPRIRAEKVLAGQFGTGSTQSYSAGQDLVTSKDHNSNMTQLQNPDVEEVVEWTNPTTKERYRINARTGIVMPEVSRRPATENTLERPAAAANLQTSSFGRPLCLERRRTAPAEATAPPSSWLDGVLQTWKNPIFANQPEQEIPVAGFEGPGNEVRENGHLTRQVQISNAFLQSGRSDTSRLSKAALAHAQVISQVDRKFILMKMPSVVGSTSEQLDFDRQLLVLMDQHAASERCILETLLAELCTPASDVAALTSNLGHTSAVTTTAQLDKPMQFQIPALEETLFKLYAAHFAGWGILYDVVGTRLNILTLPPVISERCISSPSILIELLRTEIWNMDQHPSRSRVTPTNASWIQQIGSCPSGILQLLNSRACRSAVMFNDGLESDECEALVQKLAGCVFPFMCAHGRNSVVPLVYLEGGHGGDSVALGGLEGTSGGIANGKGGKKDEGFVSAWKKWREKKV